MIITSEVKFPGFREDRHQYEQSQKEWSDVFNAALKPINHAEWEDWLRDPFFEGTPIFSRVNRRVTTGKSQGIVINQILPSDDDLGFRAYLDVFAADSDVDMVEHVVITSTLTETSKDKAEKLISAYLVHKLSPEKIARLCEDLTE
jgi:hypothetical protein